MRRTSTSSLEASASARFRSSGVAFGNSIAEGHVSPLTPLVTDHQGLSTSTSRSLPSRSSPSSTVPDSSTRIPTGGVTSTTTTAPETGPSQGPGILVMGPDGSDAKLVTTISGLFSWSPDGSSLAMTKAGMVVVVAVDGSGERTLTRAGTNAFSPLWSPDGTRISFHRSGEGLFSISADGSGTPTLVDARAIYASWSPDGRLSATTTSPGELLVYERDGTSRVLATDAFGSLAPAWAPDGSRVAYMSNRIMVVNADGSGRRAVTDMCCASEWYGSPFVWSPDGTRIAHIDGANTRTVGVDSGVVSIVATNAYNPWWSPDGQSLAVVDWSITRADGLPNFEPAVLDADGGDHHIVMTLPSTLAARSVQWSPDGTRLAVMVGPRFVPPIG